MCEIFEGRCQTAEVPRSPSGPTAGERYEDYYILFSYFIKEKL